MNSLRCAILPCFILIGLIHGTKCFTVTISTKLSKGVTSFSSLNMYSILPSTQQHKCQRQQLTKLNAAKRKRRRKQDSSSVTSFEEIGTRRVVDELPDFDLKDEDNVDNKNNKQSNKLVSNEPVQLSNTIVEGMITTTGSTKIKPTRSIQELLADRALEQKFEFDERDYDTKLPDLAPIKRTTKDTTLIASADNNNNIPITTSSIISRKKERQQEAIRLAKLAAEKEQEENERNALLNMLPGIRDENGNISPIKILETGTWACIAILFLWEIYINTPLFDRAAPMTPVVY